MFLFWIRKLGDIWNATLEKHHGIVFEMKKLRSDPVLPVSVKVEKMEEIYMG